MLDSLQGPKPVLYLQVNRYGSAHGILARLFFFPFGPQASPEGTVPSLRFDRHDSPETEAGNDVLDPGVLPDHFVLPPVVPVNDLLKTTERRGPLLSPLQGGSCQGSSFGLGWVRLRSRRTRLAKWAADVKVGTLIQKACRGTHHTTDDNERQPFSSSKPPCQPSRLSRSEGLSRNARGNSRIAFARVASATWRNTQRHREQSGRLH